MTYLQWLGVLVLLGPVYVAAIFVGYWLWWPMDPTVRVIYSHTLFCSAPCATIEEAHRLQVTSVPSGTPNVWHYREIEVTAERVGAIRAVWMSGGFIWNSPQVPTMGSRPGKYHRAVAVVPPTSNPTREFIWSTAFHYHVTPLREELIEFPDVKLTITKTP